MSEGRLDVRIFQTHVLFLFRAKMSAAVASGNCDNLSVLCSRSLYAVALAEPLACSRSDPDVVTLDGGFSHSAAAMPKEPTLFD